MASKESTDMILDLLYDELSPEETLRAKEIIAQNDDLQAEFNRLQATRAEIRTELDAALPTRDVPTSIHDSLMAAAAAHQKPTQTSTPPPSIEPRSPQTTVWSRIRHTSRAQFAAVATVAAVLITSAVLWNSTQTITSKSHFQAASQDVRNEITFGTQPQSQAQPKINKEPVAIANAPKNQAKAPNEPHEFETQKSKFDEVSEISEEIEHEPPPAEGYSSRGRAPAAPLKRLREPVMRKSPAARPTARRAQDTPSFNDFDNRDVLSESKSAASGGASPAKPSALARPQPKARPVRADNSAEFAPQGGLKKAELAGEINADNTLNDAETALSSRNFDTAIANAESVLNNARSTPNARARALHIQALAHTEQGNFKRADDAYKALQNQYPNYRNSEITRSRNALPPKPTISNPVQPEEAN